MARSDLLQGKWAWSWNYSYLGEDEIISRAERAELVGLFLKVRDSNGRTDAFLRMLEKAKAKGLLVIGEVFGYPDRAQEEAATLSWAIDQGAQGACLNAEKPWEGRPGAAAEFCQRFRQLKPDAPLFAATDFRLNRLRDHYHIELSQHVDGFVPMIYPSLFRPSKSGSYIQAAWRDVLDCWRSKSDQLTRRPPIFPAVQCFTDDNAPGVAAAGIDEQYRLALESEVAGVSWYTVEDSTPEEWERVATGEIGMATDEQARRSIEDLKDVVQKQHERMDTLNQVIADSKRAIERLGTRIEEHLDDQGSHTPSG